jgi:hypothetical protein
MDEGSISLREGYMLTVYTGVRYKQGHASYGRNPLRYVMVAELTEDSLWKVKHRVVRSSARSWREGDPFSLWVEPLVHCRYGALSSGRECRCVFDDCETRRAVCEACKRVPIPSRLFLIVNRFNGVFPYGQQYWWKGVTEAVDAGDGGEPVEGDDMWLSDV